MNLPTKREIEIHRRVNLIKDPLAEAKRRWPDFKWTTKPATAPNGKPVVEVEARWTRAGTARGFRTQIRPRANAQEIMDAVVDIARGALVAAESHP